jgi:EAL domain-containing protein (putative c-di-GMP-specific phosphodiesterase class I)
VLARWVHPVRGNISPFVFIVAAEEAGIINKIDDWILMSACQQAKKWLDKGLKPVNIAVNISGDQFSNRYLPQKIQSVLKETGLPANLLTIEITESAAMMNMKNAMVVMQGIRDLGVGLALDDFGTGYSSLSYLKNFPVEKLKIDQSFVNDIVYENEHHALLRGIIELGHSLGLKVLVEGVETAIQLDYLKRYHCDEVQGYYFSKPLTTEEFELNYIFYN